MMQATAGATVSTEAADLCRDEWKRWQQGQCGTYAYALMEMDPSLRLGVAGTSFDGGWSLGHFFAHDDTHAYDSAGRHLLPYHGIDGQMDVSYPDQHEPDYALLDEEGTDETDLRAARDHATRHRILSGRYGTTPTA